MEDYLLRVLRYRADQLEKSRIKNRKEYEEAQKQLQMLDRRIKSIERIQALLTNDTLASRVRRDLSKQLATGPGLEQLQQERKELELLINTIRVRRAELKKSHKAAIAKVQVRKVYCQELTRRFGYILATHLKPRISGEVITQIRGNRLDVYWGGQGHPLGRGHGHCILTLQGLEFRRNPRS